MNLFSWFNTPGKTLRQAADGSADLGFVKTGRSALSGAQARVLRPGCDDASQANVSLVLWPQGTGALIAGPPPDGAAVGGNNRGANAIDLCMVRTGASNVGAGAGCITLGGRNNYSLGNYSGAGGDASGTQGTACFVFGQNGYTLGVTGSAVFGHFTGSNVSYELVWGSYSIGRLVGALTGACGGFAAQGDAQQHLFVGRVQTSNATPTEVFLDGSSARISINPNSSAVLVFNFVARTSTAAGTIESACYRREVLVTRGAAVGSTTIVGEQTLGTDIISAGLAAAGGPTISADTTNGCVKVEYTGIAATNIRLVYSCHLTEVAYA